MFDGEVPLVKEVRWQCRGDEHIERFLFIVTED